MQNSWWRACLRHTKLWVQSLGSHEFGVMVHHSNPSICQQEGEGSEVQDYPLLLGEFEGNLDSLRSHLNKQTKKKVLLKSA